MQRVRILLLSAKQSLQRVPRSRITVSVDFLMVGDEDSSTAVSSSGSSSASRESLTLSIDEFVNVEETVEEDGQTEIILVPQAATKMVRVKHIYKSRYGYCTCIFISCAIEKHM